MTARPSTTVSSWQSAAACRGLDPEMFFPARGESAAEARAVCEACPVRVPCGEAALARAEHHGIWGGLSERQRRRIRRARHTTASGRAGVGS